ncbi:unnamed protein product [Cyclocybe aegerita]|uniref:Uncharacterized protein n=1 Tax=Cyclocybe aegerita TaxID=1973307 RepID=A0A8S0VTY9_CYCAE|nr:unnamed protein product [Cyclocybe aegerita]
MNSFNWMFDKDRFTLYKTWKHDSSVVYRMTTWTNTTAYFASFILPVKTNIIFLKVQEPTFEAAYDTLKNAGVELDPAARAGFDNSIGRMAVQKVAFWQTVSGKGIMEFCRRNAKNVEVGIQEVGNQRIFTIVWAPKGERVRKEDMDAFIGDNFRLQLTHAKLGLEKKALDAIVWIAKSVLLADAGIGVQQGGGY